MELSTITILVMIKTRMNSISYKLQPILLIKMSLTKCLLKTKNKDNQILIKPTTS